jgi:aldehyde dehydrogenase (NAD+)
MVQEKKQQPSESASVTEAVIKSIPKTVERLRKTFRSGRTRPLEWRLGQLKAISRMLHENEADILAALAADLGKPGLEAITSEIAYVHGEIGLLTKKLEGWMKPERVSTPVVAQPGSSLIHREPLGVCLIIGAWNYPVQLVMGPLLGAIAAGNCAVLKPSEVSPETSTILARLVPRYMDTDCVAVVEGAIPETTALLEQRFDHIFYTGNGHVGRIIMTAAAKHLTPVVLELGGQCPAIIDRNVDLDVAIRRICWGKFSNAGQTCVAPNHLLVHEAVYEQVIQKLESTLRDFYGADPKQSEDFGRIVNVRHHRRLMGLLEGNEDNIAVGGQADEDERYIAPTVVRDVSVDSKIMREEIFGPLLPVIRVSGMDEAVEIVNNGEKPLALYVFSNDSHIQDMVIQQTSSGGASINHTWMHLAVPGLPFGGVGESGMGAYHGRASFETFCHHKSVLNKSTSFDVPLPYPPYTDTKKKWIRRLL